MAEAAPIAVEKTTTYPKWSDLCYPILSMVSPDVASRATKVCVFRDGNEAIIITSDGDVYVIGHNESGCLGINPAVYGKKPITVEMKNEALCGKGICQVVASNATTGYYFAIANTIEGSVYAWGYSSQPVLGNGGTGSGPSLLDFGEGVLIRYVSCGDGHCLALDYNDQLYSWGVNTSYQLGTGDTTNKPRPMRHKLDKKLSSVICGYLNSFAISQDGEVYGWGFNANSTLGNGTQQAVTVPTILPALRGKRICQIVTSGTHTLFLDVEGAVYGCGTNTSGQVGDGTKTAVTLTKCISSNIGVFKEIATSSCGTTSVGQLVDGRVYAWGLCRGVMAIVPTETRFSCTATALACLSSLRNTCGHVHLKLTQPSRREECMKEAFQNRATADVVFVVDGKHIYAHKAILQMRCQYFRDQFRQDKKESIPGDNQSPLQIVIKKYKYDVYLGFIQYIYMDTIDIAPVSAVSLLDLSNAVHEPHLKRMCVEVVKRDINETNVAAVYAPAVMYEADDLQEFCVNYASEHMKAMVDSAAFKELEQGHSWSLIKSCGGLGVFKT